MKQNCRYSKWDKAANFWNETKSPTLEWEQNCRFCKWEKAAVCWLRIESILKKSVKIVSLRKTSWLNIGRGSRVWVISSRNCRWSIFRRVIINLLLIEQLCEIWDLLIERNKIFSKTLFNQIRRHPVVFFLVRLFGCTIQVSRFTDILGRITCLNVLPRLRVLVLWGNLMRVVKTWD